MHRQIQRQLHLLGDDLCLSGRVEIMGERPGANRVPFSLRAGAKGMVTTASLTVRMASGWCEFGL